MSIDISVVIPVYNSEKALEELYIRTSNILNDLCGENYEIILVDDNSKDNSYLKMKDLHKRDKKIKIVQLTKNFGQQNALMCGFHYVQGKYIITIDDDLQHPPEEIKKLIDKLNEGYDVVFGIPIEKKHSFYRNLGSKMIHYLFNIISMKPKDIRLSSFRGMKREIVKDIIKNKTSFVYIAPMIFKRTTKVENVFVKHEERKYGKSNYDFLKLIKLVIKIVKNYSKVSMFFTLSSDPQFQIKNIEP